MEEGASRTRQDSVSSHCTEQHDSQHNSVDSKVFDLVIDPHTDFQTIEEKSEVTSPQEAYNLQPQILESACEDSYDTHKEKRPPSPYSPSHLARSVLYGRIELLTSLPDSQVWGSDGSLGSSVELCGGGGGGGGGSCGGSTRRLAVAGVHRFGVVHTCVDSPHDLVSCPACPDSIPTTSPWPDGRTKNCTEIPSLSSHSKFDALKTLTETSSALALTETLIGPLGIPPVPQEVISEVVCNMEKRGKVSVPVQNENHNSSKSLREVDLQTKTIARNEGTFHHTSGSYMNPHGAVGPDSLGNGNSINPPVSSNKSSLSKVTPDAKEPSKMTSSMHAVSELGVHKKLDGVKSNGSSRDSRGICEVNKGMITPEYLTLSQDEVLNSRQASQDESKQSKLITIPVGMSDHGPVEVYREVHRYPASSITTTVERRSYIGLSQADSQTEIKKKKLSRLKKNRGKNHLSSNSSLVSESSNCSSVASVDTLVSASGSELSVNSCSHVSKTSLNDGHSESAVPISKSLLSASIAHIHNTSDNHSDRSYNGLEVGSTFSDTSSNLSTLSDLSGYEEEYVRIKRLVSDAVISPEDYKKMISKVNSKPCLSKPVPSVDNEKIIRDLHAQKEDLEIQLHRLSIQVQNAVREKELYQQQLELVQTKVTETNQKQYFEVLKQRANLEGQLEMLKQELETSVYEKNKLQGKLSESLKESESCKALATSAKEAESQMKARLEKYETANKDLEERTKDSEKKIEKLGKELNLKQEEIKGIYVKCDSSELLVAELRENESCLLGEIKGLKSQVSHLQNECQSTSELLAQTESSSNKLSVDLNASQTSNTWYQEQLQAAQAARSDLQQDLLQARASLAKATSEKESLETRVAALMRESEDEKARMVTEKASLVAHLEALQADMAEREAVVSQLERDRGTDTRLMEDRQQRLERDRQEIHRLRLNLTDAERHLDFARQDLKHKSTLLARYEDELKDLRTSVAVNEEILRERDTRIENYEKTVKEMKDKDKKHQIDRKSHETLIAELQERKVKLEASLVAANSEKKEVDDAIAKVREDMTKLTSNFYRMKHDLAAKDRHIEVMTKELNETINTKSVLLKKIETLELIAKNKEDVDNFKQEIETLKQSLKEATEGREKLKGELGDLGQKYKALEIEKKGLFDAVHLREEQIQNLQESQESYREAILKKDEELYMARESGAVMERTCADLQRNLETLKEENMALRHEGEAYAEHEELQKKEKVELKEGLQKERKLKQNLERKLETLVKAHEEDRCKIINEKENAEKMVNELTGELKQLKADQVTVAQKDQQVQRKYNELNQELNAAKEEKCRVEKKLVEVTAELDKSKSYLVDKSQAIQSMDSRYNAVCVENNSIKEKLSSMQESEQKVVKLNSLLELKSREMLSIQKKYSDTECSLEKLLKEKTMLVAQVNNLVAENTHLKKTNKTSETLVKESNKTTVNASNTSGKHSKGSEHTQKEVFLNKKVSELEVKLKESNRQRESLQVAVKNLKKDNILARAKTKEFESLRKRCSELELSNTKIEETESLKAKIIDLESKLESNCKEVSSLTHSLNDKINTVQILKQREQDLGTQVQSLHVDRQETQTKLMQLESDLERTQDAISNYQQQLKILEGERDEWLAKFESLRDCIPERDTSRQPAVQLHTSNHQPDERARENGSVNNKLSFLGNVPQAPITNGTEFQKTMADLQEQVSLTSEALQNKELHIHQLQHRLISLQQEGSSTLPQSASGVGEMVQTSVHSQQISELLKRIQNLKVSSDTCTNCNQQNDQQERSSDESEVKSLLEKINCLESQFSKKEEELKETQTKMTTTINEFREKQRRYESNVRLLTRKLKEHMKGRKSAEKEMQMVEENHQTLLNEERQRYEALRSRCLEVEGEREKLEGELKVVENEVGEMSAALNHARQEAQQHHTATLALQKELGCLQENCKALEGVRLTVTALEEKLSQKEKTIEELERVKVSGQEKLHEAQTTSVSLTTNMKLISTEKDQLHSELEATKISLEGMRKAVKEKESDHQRLQHRINQLEAANNNLREGISKSEATQKHITEEMRNMREERQAAQDHLQDVTAQLHCNLTKITALEDNIKVLEGEIKMRQEEVRHSKGQLEEKEECHQTRVSQLEQSIGRAVQEVATLTTQLASVQQERLSYQTQATQLRTALHTTLAQLKAYKAAEEMGNGDDSDLGEDTELPSPAPLDLEGLTQLMERSARPVTRPAPLLSLQSCLSSLKAEVNTLQTQLQHKAQQAAKELNADDSGISDSMAVSTVDSCEYVASDKHVKVETV